MARKKIKSATDQRHFTLIYNDFLESNVLNYYEKMVFIALKKFADNDTMRAFPSLKTIHKITGISQSQIRRSIDHMKELGVLSVEHRLDDERGHQSNVYTLYDYAEMWSAGGSEEIEKIKKDNSVDLSKVSTDRLIKELERRNKEKELVSEPTKVNTQALKKYHSDIDNNKADQSQCQAERYSLEEIKQLYDYDIMVHDRPEYREDIDGIMSILQDVLNTTKSCIRVNSENKPAMTVIGKLEKLTYSEIMYVIEKYHERTKSEKIIDPSSYILTFLYNAHDRMSNDISNQVRYNMYHQETDT